MSQVQEEHIEHIEGTTLTIDLMLFQDDETTIIPEEDLLGAVAELQIRSRLFNDTVAISSIGVIDPITAMVQFTITAAELAPLLPVDVRKEVLVYGTNLTFDDTSSIPLIGGKLTLIKGAYR